MRISELRTINKSQVKSSTVLLTADNTTASNAKLKVESLFPNIVNAIGSTNVGLIGDKTNQNEFSLSRIAAKDSKITVTGGGGTNDVLIGLGAITYADISGNLSGSDLLGGIDAATQLNNITPIANGGTGTSLTTFVDLTANVTGVLPTTGGGTGLASYSANRIFYAGTSSTISQLAAATDGQVILGATGAAPAFASLVSGDSSLTFTAGTNSLDIRVGTLPAVTADISFSNAGDRTLKIADKAAGGRNLTVQGGNSTSSGAGGNLTLEGGDAGAGGADPGDVIIQTGLVGDPSTNPGTVSLKVGSTTGGHQEVLQVTGSHQASGYAPSVTISNGTTASGTQKGTLYLHQGQNASGLPALYVQQDDQDQPFIDFRGTAAADQTKSITTDTSVGALTGHILCKVGGTDYWIPYYAKN